MTTKRQFETVDRFYDGEDNMEGFKAFAEKRGPVWKGRREAAALLDFRYAVRVQPIAAG